MSYGLTLITPPSGEPITVDELKAHARIADHDADNDVLAAFITTAREYFETRTDRQLLTATWLLTLDRFPGRDPDDSTPLSWRFGVVRIPRPPLQAVTLVQYVDADGATQTLATSEYQVSAARSPGRVAPARFKVWPIADPFTLDAVRVTFVAGYGAASAVPQRMKTAIALLAGHLYENREATAEVALSKLPYGLESMIRTAQYGEYT